MSKCLKILTNIAVVAIVIQMFSCKKTEQKYSITGEAQGSYFAVTYYDTENRDFTKEIDSLLKAFDQTASLWVENSMIRRINNNDDSVINDLFCDLLNKSLLVNKETRGYFDCTIGVLVNAWGFGFKNKTLLDSSMVDSLRQFIGQPLEVVNKNGEKILHKPFPEIEIDFNAIAQGYSVDMIGNFLEKKGITRYLVDIGGEVLTKGCKPTGEKWIVGIEKPAETKYSDQEIDIMVTLDNQSIVTSGNYRKYYEKDGVKYSHTIDPFTGYPVSHSLLSVSVIADEAWIADAYATAFMVMGIDKSLQFIENHKDINAVYFIYNEDGEYKTFATKEFEKHIVK